MSNNESIELLRVSLLLPIVQPWRKIACVDIVEEELNA